MEWDGSSSRKFLDLKSVSFDVSAVAEIPQVPMASSLPHPPRSGRLD